MAFAKVANGLKGFETKLRSRFEASTAAAKHKNRTYIVPTGFGFIFGLISLVLLMMALGYANNLLYFLVFFLISVALSAMFITNQNLAKIRIVKIQTSDFFAQENGQIHVSLANLSKKSSNDLRVHIGKLISEPFSVGGLEEKKVSLPWTFDHRGTRKLPRISVHSAFPFGLLRAWKVFTEQTHVLVFPEKKSSLEIFSANLNQSPNSENDLFRGLRPYQFSDPISRIDWRATSKHQLLLVRNFETQSLPSFDFDWEQTSDISYFEDKISQLAFWIFRAGEHQHHFSLKVGFTQFPTSTGRLHRDQCLSFLALMKEFDSSK